MTKFTAQTDAEYAVVGSLLQLSPAATRDLLDGLLNHDLTDPRLRIVLTAIPYLVQRGLPPDPILVLGELRRTGADNSFLDDQSAGVFLASVCGAALNPASATHHARIVIEHSWRRRIQQSGLRLEQISGTTSLADLEQHNVAEVKALQDFSLRWRKRYGEPLEGPPKVRGGVS